MSDASCKDESGCLPIAAGFWAGAILGALAIAFCARLSWRADAVSRGVAGYDATTGEWEWKVQPIKAGAKP